MVALGVGVILFHMEKEGSVVHFLKYNNTVPIILGILFLSTTATMAASPAVRESVYSAETAVVSVDNSYILSLDVEDYPFAMRIVSIVEDDLYYYVTYDFDTVDIIDSVWQDVIKRQELRVSKQLLGSGNLKPYIESELAQVLSSEIDKLVQTQMYEKRLGSSQKVVATEYRGLVGKFVDPSEERVPQYQTPIPKNDPLRVKNPQPLVTWDENNQPEPEEPVRPRFPDQCPGIAGIQTSEDECEPSGGGEEEPPSEEPPVEEPPVEEPPVEELPAEEPPAEEPPAEQSPAETPPADTGSETPSTDTGGDTSSDSGSSGGAGGGDSGSSGGGESGGGV